MDEEHIPQWDEVYPDRMTLEDDIKKNQMYTFALSTGFADWRKGRFELREKKL